MVNSKKIATIALAGAILAGTGLMTAGCGNMDVFDMHFTLNYAVTEENGQHILHKVERWADSDSESVTFHTSCCNNYIWTSANRAVFYENKPDETAYDVVCKG